MNMKFPVITILLLSACVAASTLSAQNEQMSEEQMQQMMENAEQMQDCMANIDQKAMEDYAARGEKVHTEIQKLCAAGKRDEAQNMAMDYGKEMAASKEIQAMQKCGVMAQGMVRQMPGPDDAQGPRHVCDEM